MSDITNDMPLSRAEAIDLHWLIAVAIHSGSPRGDMLNLAQRLSERVADYAGGDTSTTDAWLRRTAATAHGARCMNIPAHTARCPENAEPGTPILAYPVSRHDPPIITRTRSEVRYLGDGTPVVAVEGRPGGIRLTHIDVLPPGILGSDS